MATSTERMMNVSWVFAAGYNLDPTVAVEQIKKVGPSWGSWKTWRSCGTDNVICDDLSKTRELLARAFQAVCNFHTRREYFMDLGRPVGLKWYNGEFNQQTNDIEDIIAMHLCCDNTDIVLLAGFDFSKPAAPADAFQRHKIANRHGLQHNILSRHPDIQFVIIDHPEEMDKNYQNLSNLTCDSLDNALQLLV